jgi:hypothetical protein
MWEKILGLLAKVIVNQISLGSASVQLSVYISRRKGKRTGILQPAPTHP